LNIDLSLKREVSMGVFAAKLALFLAVFFLANRNWIFQDGIIMGHNWDFTFPGTDELARGVFRVSHYLWSSLQDKTILLQSHVVQNTMYSIIATISGASLTIKIIYSAAILASYLNMSLLLKLLTRRRDVGLGVIAMTYAFSPYFFSTVIAGSWYGWLAYAFAPLYFVAYQKICMERDRRYLLALALSGVFLMGFLQYFAIVNAFLIISMIYWIVTDRISWRQGIISFAEVSLLLILLNAVWIIPLGASFAEFNANIIQNPEIYNSFQAVKTSRHSMNHIIDMTGFLDRNLYAHALSPIARWVYGISIGGFWLVIMGALLLSKNSFRRTLLFYLILLIGLCLLVKGGNAPFGNLTLWIYQKVIFLKMYRSPQNLFMGIAFLFPVLLALADTALDRISQRKRTLMLFLLVMGFLSGWLQSGDIGHISLHDQNRDHIDFYRMDPEIEQIYSNSEGRKLVHGEFFVPNTISPAYLPSLYQKKGQGMIPELLYLKNRGVYLENIDNSLLLSMQKEVPRFFFAGNSIRYVTVRSDIKHHHWSSPESYVEKTKKKFVNEMPVAYAGKRHSTYQVPDDIFLPVFYVEPKPTIMKGPGVLKSIYNYSRVAVNPLPKFPTQTMTPGGHSLRDVQIEYKRVSPVKYRLALKNIPGDGRFLLRFTETFDSHWRLYPGKARLLYGEAMATSKFLKQYEIASLDCKDQATRAELEEMLTGAGLCCMPERGAIAFVSKNFSGSIQNNNLPDGQFYETWGSTRLSGVTHLQVQGIPKPLNGYWMDVEAIIKESPGAASKRPDGRYDLHIVAEFDLQKKFAAGLVISVASFLFCAAFSLIPGGRFGGSARKS